MKVLWVSHVDGLSGGAERSLLEGARGLAARGHDVRVLVPSPGPLAERLWRHHIPVSVLPSAWWMHSRPVLPVLPWLHNMKAWAKLDVLLRRKRPDVVISNTLTVPVGALASRSAGIPHVWYIHEFGFEDHGLTFDIGKRVALAAIRNLSARVIVNSRTLYAAFERAIPESKLRLLYYGVDVPSGHETLTVPAEPFRLILVGRVCAGKGQEEAIRAAAFIAGKGIAVHLTILGDGDGADRSALRQLAQDLGVQHQVEFLSFTDDPFHHVARAHVALMCSHHEAFGRVTVEAMKLGKPVIGANAASAGELIQDGTTGLLYRPGDAGDLSLKIETLYRNRPLLQEMGRNAQDWSIRTFSVEKYASDLASILDEAVATPSGSVAERRNT